jgi:hypothetical protein
VSDRLASIERMVTSQQEEISSQQEEITALRRELEARRASPPRALDATRGDRATTARGGRRASRRDLLKLGGAAAAAGVAVVASELTGHAPSVLAAPELDSNYVQMGVNYQNQCATGTFLAPVPLSSPVTLLDVDNSSTLTSDTLHACGVKGWGPSGGTGVMGGANGSNAKGVWGQSDAGIGVLAQSGSGVDLWLGGTGRLYQTPQGSAGAPTSGGHFPGEQIRDAKGELWICVGAGTPGTWMRVAGVANNAAGGAMNFLAGIQRTVWSGNTSDPGVHIALGSPQSFPIASVGGIPGNATGVFGTVTCYASAGSGFVSVYPAGGSASGGSINYTASDEPLSNFVASGLGAGGQITVASFAHDCKFIYDVVGYTL